MALAHMAPALFGRCVFGRLRWLDRRARCVRFATPFAAYSLLLLSLSLSPCTHAQTPAPPPPPNSWTVTYSGGTGAITNDGPNQMPWHQDYTNITDASGAVVAYGGAGTSADQPGSDGPNHTDSGAGSAGCAGAITATVTWTGPDPPPPAVILKEDVIAGWTGKPPGVHHTGSDTYADDSGGSGGTASTPTDTITSSPASETESEVFYRVVSNPPGSFRLTVSPDSGGSTPGNTGGGKAGAANSNPSTASANVSYSVKPTSVTIDFGTSTTKFGNVDKILIGQKLTATLNTGTYTQSGWEWSVDDGKPFKNWTVTSGPAPYDSHATYTPLGTETQSSLYCYFADPTSDKATVTCTAHIDTPGGGVDVTANRKVTLDKPYFDIKYAAMGTPVDLPDSTNPNTEKLLLSKSNPGGTGIIWKVIVVTPSGYSGYGEWCTAQIVTPLTQGVFADGDVVSWLIGYQNYLDKKVFGIPCLDTTYPYNGTYVANGHPNSTDPTQFDGDFDSDAPHMPLEASDNWSSFDGHEKFDDYFMYSPPGASLPVPLQTGTWFWKFHAVRSGGVWTTSNKDQNSSMGVKYPPHPTWSIKAEGEHLNELPPDYQPTP